jgi:short-subunit dehydrogenase
MGWDTPPATAVVTGASSGIGAAYAERLAGRGWDVVLVARREDRLAALARGLSEGAGVRAEALPADLARPDDVARVAERVAADDVGLLVNNAGINGYGPFPRTGAGLLGKVIDVNAAALTALTHAAVRGMLARGGGAVVNVASLLAFAGAEPPGALPHRAVYGGTKAYVVAFTRTLAAELAGRGPRLQALCPGLTATEFHLSTGEGSVPDGAPPVHGEGGMPAEDVVTASLAALDAGEVVCVPGLADPAAVARLTEAEAALRLASGAPLAPRYRDREARWDPAPGRG